jgi:uncharacterized alpha-E superfamily protein
MKRNRGKVTGTAVAAFLVSEPRFPRSVQYCVTSARQRLAAITGDGGLPGKLALTRALALETWLASVATEELRGARVHEVLTHVVNEAHAVCDAIGAELWGPPQSVPIVSAQAQ